MKGAACIATRATPRCLKHPCSQRTAPHHAEPKPAPAEQGTRAGGAGEDAQASDAARRKRIILELQRHPEHGHDRAIFGSRDVWGPYCSRLPVDALNVRGTEEKGVSIFFMTNKTAGAVLWREPAFAHMVAKSQLGKLCMYCCRPLGARSCSRLCGRCSAHELAQLRRTLEIACC